MKILSPVYFSRKIRMMPAAPDAPPKEAPTKPASPPTPAPAKPNPEPPPCHWILSLNRHRLPVPVQTAIQMGNQHADLSVSLLQKAQ